jgi:hypothetical protein
LPADAPGTIAEVLDRVQVEWAALQFVVSGLSDEELTSVGPEKWAVKDHLAHIAEWEHACTGVLAHRPQAEAFAVDAEAYRDIDSLNDALYQRHRNESIADVKALANAAHADMVAAISELTDSDLQRSVGEYGMQTNPDRQLIEKIAGDTYEHYAEHTVWIKELLSAM